MLFQTFPAGFFITYIGAPALQSAFYELEKAAGDEQKDVAEQMLAATEKEFSVFNDALANEGFTA